MADERDVSRRAAIERDAAHVRVRRVTGIALAASVAAVGALAGYVSSAASGRKVVRRAAAPRAVRAEPRRPSQVPVPAVPPPPRLIRAAAPPQSNSDESPSPPAAPRQPAPAPAQPAPAPQPPVQAPAPVPVQAPPVVVSGGS